MWAQTWENIEDMLKPFPDSPTLSTTAAMKKQVIIYQLHDYQVAAILLKIFAW